MQKVSVVSSETQHHDRLDRADRPTVLLDDVAFSECTLRDVNLVVSDSTRVRFSNRFLIGVWCDPSNGDLLSRLHPDSLVFASEGEFRQVLEEALLVMKDARHSAETARSNSKKRTVASAAINGLTLRGKLAVALTFGIAVPLPHAGTKDLDEVLVNGLLAEIKA